jgi:lambda family phage portal protein
VAGPIKRNVRNVVGQGIRFQSAVKADDPIKKHEFPLINDEVADIAVYSFEKYFAKWQKQADVRLLQTFYEQQGIVEGALMRDGECLVIGRESKRKDRVISYAIEVLEADRLMNPINEIHNPKIRHGIEYDDEGAPVYYHILKVHPGETMLHALKNPRWETDQVPAYFKNPGNGKLKKVLHLYNPIRPEQTRGFSGFISGLKDLHDLDRYMEAEKLAALEDACMTGIVKTTDPSGFAGGYTIPSDRPEGYERINEYGPTMTHYLMPNEDFDIHKPSRPNTQLGDFINQLMRGPANAIDMPPEVFGQNWQGMNYSNARTVLLNFYAACAMRQWYLINHMCIPVSENVLTRLVIKGKAIAPGFDRRRDDYLACTWIPAVFRKWIDPLKEAKGKDVDLDNMVEALPDILAEQGKDEDEHLEKIARTKVKIKKLEEKY